MKPVVIAYLPPDGPRFNTRSFIQNLAENPAGISRILFSDTKYEDVPDLLHIPHSPDAIVTRGIGENRVWDVNNWLFLTAIRMAIKNGFTHVLYLEADCRVLGAGWAQAMFDEFFESENAPMFAGSIVAYNVANSGKSALRRYNQFVASNRRNPFPIPPYGWKSASDSSGSCVYPNGAGAIFPVAALQALFSPEELDKSLTTAKKIAPWDQEIGFRLWKEMGESAYDVLLHMRTQYSAYGNVLSSEEERMTMLMNGAVRMVHQIKSAWVPPFVNRPQTSK